MILNNKYKNVNVDEYITKYDYKNVASCNINLFTPSPSKVGTLSTGEQITFLKKEFNEFKSIVNENQNVEIISNNIIAKAEYDAGGSWENDKVKRILFSFSKEINEKSKYNEFFVEFNDNRVFQRVGLNVDGFAILGQDNKKSNIFDVVVYNSFEEFIETEYGLENNNIIYIKNEFASYGNRVAIVKNRNFVTFYILISSYTLLAGTNYVIRMVLDSNINIYMKSISQESLSIKTNLDNSSNSIEILNNYLLQDGTIYKPLNRKMSSIITNNILSDYINGVQVATISICCNDYFDENNNLIKNWANGEIIEVGDVVKVEGYAGIWRVTGRNFRKIGVPMVDLELQEI